MLTCLCCCSLPFLCSVDASRGVDGWLAGFQHGGWTWADGEGGWRREKKTKEAFERKEKKGLILMDGTVIQLIRLQELTENDGDGVGEAAGQA